jgi:hypothetical protein
MTPSAIVLLTIDPKTFAKTIIGFKIRIKLYSRNYNVPYLLPIIVLVGFKGSFRVKQIKLFIKAKKNDKILEKAVASLGKKLNAKSENGIVILPPEIPEIAPIPDNKAIVRIPSTSAPKKINSHGKMIDNYLLKGII